MPGDDGYGEQDALAEGVSGLGIDKDPGFGGGDGDDDPFKVPIKLPGEGGQDGDVLGPDPETESGGMGSMERGRDLRSPSKTPTTFSPQGLPQGVTVDDGMFSGVPDGGNTMDMPGQSFSPSPRSGNLSFAMPESGRRPQGPQRRSASPSVLYSQGNSPTLSGRAGGLLEGGLGASGQSDQTGPLQPTDLFQRLLQMMGRA